MFLKAGDLTDNLDNLDLLCAEVSQLDVELSLLFLSCSCRTCNHNSTGCCGDTECLFAGLYELVQLKNGQLFDRFDKFSSCKFSHCMTSL